MEGVMLTDAKNEDCEIKVWNKMFIELVGTKLVENYSTKKLSRLDDNTDTIFESGKILCQ